MGSLTLLAASPASKQTPCGQANGHRGLCLYTILLWSIKIDTDMELALGQGLELWLWLELGLGIGKCNQLWKIWKLVYCRRAVIPVIARPAPSVPPLPLTLSLPPFWTFLASFYVLRLIKLNWPRGCAAVEPVSHHIHHILRNFCTIFFFFIYELHELKIGGLN